MTLVAFSFDQTGWDLATQVQQLFSFVTRRSMLQATRRSGSSRWLSVLPERRLPVHRCTCAFSSSCKIVHEA